MKDFNQAMSIDNLQGFPSCGTLLSNNMPKHPFDDPDHVVLTKSLMADFGPSY